MARTRYYKPSFPLDEELSTALTPLQRLVYLGMQTVADYKGCFEWRPKAIKAQVAPFERVDLERVIEKLVAIDRVYRYVVNGREYVKIRDFDILQNPHKQEVEKGSKIPDFVPGTEIKPAENVSTEQVQQQKETRNGTVENSAEISNLETQSNQYDSGEMFGTSSESVPPSPSPSLSPSPSPSLEREELPPADFVFEDSPFDHPAVQIYQEKFCVKVGSHFAKEVADRVKDLGAWTALISDKIALADEPLDKRSRIASWFLKAYDERLEEKQTGGKFGNKGTQPTPQQARPFDEMAFQKRLMEQKPK